MFKPLCGIEPELEANLRSFAAQDYPRFQIIFCSRRADDPALDVARAVANDYPHVDIAFAVGDTSTLPNPKIANVETGLPLATGEIFVIADADVQAGSGCLRAIAGAFVDERVGAASCMYGARSAGGAASALGALHINDHFAPSVLVAAALEPVRFCLGATMAVRRTVLDEIGGFPAIGSRIGDDYTLGAAVAARGYRVALVPEIVTCIANEPATRALFAHLVRWGRTIRSQRPLGYAFSFLTIPLPFALLAVALARGSAAALAIALGVAAIRALAHVRASKTFGSRGWADALLVPLSDAFELATWFWSFLGNAVDWRSQRFDLRKGTRGGPQ